ncbi:MAG: hypothetical protein IID51_11240 [Proteobacteria bacterium]|nr:hypothetical protein [Pseudomonadota bacterium]
MGYAFFDLLFVVVPLLLIGVPVALVVLFRRTARTEREIKRISGNMDIVYRRLSGDEQEPSKPPEPEPTPSTAPSPTLPPFAVKAQEAPPAAPPFAAKPPEGAPATPSEPQSGAMAPAARPAARAARPCREII